MESTNSFYQTEAGKNLLNTLHGNYWDARETIHAMIDAVENAIPAADAAARKELEAKLQSLRTAYAAVGTVTELLEDATI
ncbi:MAG: hypothetical protein IJU70_06930 [Lentisphaeria bacterium]|nr:hypothetical protein [Lentisphaeria bacterium]